MIDEKSPKDAYQEHLDAARNANAGSAITIWKDGNWKRWNELDAKYAEKDPDWLLTIPLSEGEAPSPEYIQKGDFLYMSSGDVYKLCRSAEAPSPVRAEISEKRAMKVMYEAYPEINHFVCRKDGLSAAFRALQSIATITEKE